MINPFQYGGVVGMEIGTALRLYAKICLKLWHAARLFLNDLLGSEGVQLAICVSYPGTTLDSALLLPAVIIQLTQAPCLGIFHANAGKLILMLFNETEKRPPKHRKILFVGFF